MYEILFKCNLSVLHFSLSYTMYHIIFPLFSPLSIIFFLDCIIILFSSLPSFFSYIMSTFSFPESSVSLPSLVFLISSLCTLPVFIFSHVVSCLHKYKLSHALFFPSTKDLSHSIASPFLIKQSHKHMQTHSEVTYTLRLLLPYHQDWI